jgi:hypothetical protein
MSDRICAPHTLSRSSAAALFEWRSVDEDEWVLVGLVDNLEWSIRLDMDDPADGGVGCRYLSSRSGEFVLVDEPAE